MRRQRSKGGFIAMENGAAVPISISARHLHLTREHVDLLFGPGHRLTEKAPLSQPGQFACEETLTITGPKNQIPHVRILGPERKESQVEISKTDGFTLGIKAPVRASGELDGTPGITLTGPAGELEIPRGVIEAQRHVHMSPEDAEHFGVKDKDWVMVRVGGSRGIIFDDVLVRVSRDYRLDMHIDTDEANAADIQQGSTGILIRGPVMVKPEPND
ncbi:MAG: phosphate propanoyltransferase [Candidatus Xenobiia bacterium LiM19]